MRTRRTQPLLPVVGLVAAALVLMTPGTSSALSALPGGPNDPVTDTVTTVVPGQQGQPAPEAQEQSAPADARSTTESSDDDSVGHETDDPTSPDHGRATVADLGAAGEKVVTLGDSNATVKDDDSTTADATLLALGGEQVLGTSADSTGTKESHFGDPLAPLCEGSEGQVCLRVLYADAWASDDGDTSRTRSSSGVADVCLGGDDAEQGADCTGPADVSAASSTASAKRDQESGRTSAASRSSVADVCLERDAETGTCAVGLIVLESKGSSRSGGAQPSADRESVLVAVTLGNEERARFADAQSVGLPPECPAEASLLCLFLNQGETYVKKSAAGHAQEALHLDVLPGILDLKLELGRSESLVHNDRIPTPKAEVKGVEKTAPSRAAPVVTDVTGVLPNTGGFWSGLIALALLTLGAGSLLLAIARRRMSLAV